MRVFAIFIFFISALTAFGQDSTAYRKQVREELTQLFNKWNRARLNYDRKGLEQIFADDYVFIHGHGFIDNKAATVDDQLNTDTIQPVPIPDFDALQVFEDVAILKRLIKGPQGSNYNTNIFIKKNGKWLFAVSQTTLLQPERKTVIAKIDSLHIYLGKYESQGRFLTVTNENDTLVASIVKISKRKLSFAGSDIFFDKTGADYKFLKNENGKITGIFVRPRFGQEVQWKKIH
jgi:hypothetical protein